MRFDRISLGLPNSWPANGTEFFCWFLPSLRVKRADPATVGINDDVLGAGESMESNHQRRSIHLRRS